MSNVEVTEGKHVELEEHIDDAESEIEDDEVAASSAAAEFRAHVIGSADLAERAANVQITNALVRDVVSAAKKAVVNPFEAVSRNSPAPRLDSLAARRDSILSAATDAEVGTAHAMFLEAVFAVDMSTVKPEDRGAASDKLLTEMIHRVRGEAMPPSVDRKADAYVETLVDVWKGVDDAGFWHSMAAAWDGAPITAEEAKSHLLFLRTVGDLTPLALARESFLWRTPSAKLSVVEKIAAAGGAAPDPTANPQGRIDIAAMYRQAANSSSLGKPVPRYVATELVRLALAELVGGVRRAGQRAPRTVTPVREIVTRTLATETAPSGSDKTGTAQVTDRNATRSAARELLTTTDSSLDKDSKSTPIDPERALSLASVAENFREGRRELGGVFQHLSDYLNLALKRAPGGDAEAKRVADVVSRSGLADALSKWSELYAARTNDLGALRDALGDLKVRAKAIVDGVGTSTKLDPVSQLSFAMRIAVAAAGTEVGRQAAELIAASNGGPKPDPGAPLGGARNAMDIASSRGRARRAAIMARERAGGLGDLVTKSLKAYKDVPWAEAAKGALTAWTAADQTDVATMLQNTQALASALDTVRAKLAIAPAADRYIGSSVIDALAFAVMDRVQTLAATGGEVTDAQRDALVKALSTSTPPFIAPADLTNYWSKGKDTIAGRLPSGLTLDLTGRIKAWTASVSAQPIDLSVISTRSFSVVQAVTDYRTRIEAGMNSPADKAILLGLLDTVLASMQTRLQAIGTT